MVAEDHGQLVGYACSAGVDFSGQFPILAAMIASFRRLTYLGTTLIDTRVCIYGPVCVDRTWRGRGVLRGLITRMKEELAGSSIWPELSFPKPIHDLSPRTWTAWA